MRACMFIKALSSVMQLSTFTRITSIPREKNYNDYPVTVRVKAQEMTLPQCPPVDIVALVDISGSMGPDEAVTVSGQKTTKLEQEKKAMGEVIKHFGSDQNRLAVVAFNNIPHVTGLKDMTNEWRVTVSEKVKDQKAKGDTDIVQAMNQAREILDGRKAEEKRRLAFIILFCDGNDPDLRFNMKKIPTTYPIHAFGFWADPEHSQLEAMRELSLGSYTPVNEAIEKVTEKLGQLSYELASVLAVDTRISLKSMHPGVILSKIDPSADHEAGVSYGSQISEYKESGEIFVGVVRSGKDREFTVYLNVPEGDQGTGANAAMDLLTVGGSYKQSWDQQPVGLDESVVTVARPASEQGSCSCKELDWIEERLEYWCKVKQDWYKESAGNNSKCQCLVSEALREASLEAINSAMHQDICAAVQHALKMRLCGNGGTTMENVPSPTQCLY